MPAGTGIGTAMAGREIPRTRPMRSNAAAILAPVFPAPTMAWARPSRTAWAERTSEESLFGAARRLRVLTRGVLRLGTAMGCLSVSAQIEFGQRGPARVRRRRLFVDDVRRARSTTGRLARRG